MKTTFEIVCWPDIQVLMELDGFNENAYLINDEKGLEEYGSSAYFVNSDWLRKNTKDNQPFDIPDLKKLFHQVAEYVNTHHGGKGFICTDHPDGNIILTFIYNDSQGWAEEFYVKAVRVNKEGKLQIIYDLPSVKYTVEIIQGLEEDYWHDIDEDIIYYEQTIFNIAYNIQSYENL